MIIYISGGARSGKSNYAQNRALELDQFPVYLATARHWDPDFSNRIKRHRDERNSRFISIEAEKDLVRTADLYESKNYEAKTIVIDCVTLWLTNYFSDYKDEPEQILDLIKEDFLKFTAVNATYLFISNEIGMGAHPDNAVGRRFQDYQGWLNQFIAAQAREVIFMVSGIPVKIKP